jgi:hypothetical protein
MIWLISVKKTAKMQRLIILNQLGKILGVRIYPILRYNIVGFIESDQNPGFFSWIHCPMGIKAQFFMTENNKVI